jgi:hypothetical protein
MDSRPWKSDTLASAALRKTYPRRVARVDWMFTFVLAAYNRVRMRKLLPTCITCPIGSMGNLTQKVNPKSPLELERYEKTYCPIFYNT